MIILRYNKEEFEHALSEIKDSFEDFKKTKYLKFLLYIVEHINFFDGQYRILNQYTISKELSEEDKRYMKEITKLHKAIWDFYSEQISNIIRDIKSCKI